MKYEVYKVRIYSNGSKKWYQNGKLHRLDGPAVEQFDGTKVWYQNGQLHRLDGPAVEYPNGDKSWWFDGNRHCLDGPAAENINGYKAWYIDGVELTEAEFNKHITSALCDSTIIEVNDQEYRGN